LGSQGSVRSMPCRECVRSARKGRELCSVLRLGFQSLPTRRALDCQPCRRRITRRYLLPRVETQAIFVAYPVAAVRCLSGCWSRRNRRGGCTRRDANLPDHARGLNQGSFLERVEREPTPARHPVKPFAARRDDRPPSTPHQRLKSTQLRHWPHASGASAT
jgi:hypothetical protein